MPTEDYPGATEEIRSFEPIWGPLRKSRNFGAVAAALAKAHLEFKPIKKERTNPFYKSKYADLEAVIAATAPALAAAEVAVIQSPSTTDRTVMVTTLLAHSSGEWFESDLTLPADQDNKFNAQTVGSAITYTRRYALLGMLNVSAEDDDDGNAASGGGTVKMPERKSAPPQQSTKTESKPTPTFAQKFWAAAKNSGKSEEEVRRHLGSEGYASTAEIPAKNHEAFMDWAEGK